MNGYFMQTAFQMVAEGNKRGLSATAQEISAQEKAFNAMFPGILASKQLLKNEVIAKKYARTLPGSQVSDKNIQNAYTQLQKEFSRGKASPTRYVFLSQFSRRLYE